jgi:hypothetical protein
VVRRLRTALAGLRARLGAWFEALPLTVQLLLAPAALGSVVLIFGFVLLLGGLPRLVVALWVWAGLNVLVPFLLIVAAGVWLAAAELFDVELVGLLWRTTRRAWRAWRGAARQS